MRTLALPLLLFTSLPVSALAVQDEFELEEAPEVEVALVADVAAVRPGATFHLGVRFTIPEHWHIYWENPGDSGVPTEVAVRAPDGFRVGKPLYPGPKSYELPGDLVVFGYEDEVILFVPVEAPAKVPAGGNARFTVSADWLVCKVNCFVGSGDAKLSLPIAPAGPPSAADRKAAKALAEQRALLPLPATGLENVTSRWEVDGAIHRVHVNVGDCDDVEFFPAAETPLNLKRRTQKALGSKRTVTLDWKPRYGDTSPRIAALGLLRVRRGETTRYYEVELDKASAAKKPANSR